MVQRRFPAYSPAVNPECITCTVRSVAGCRSRKEGVECIPGATVDALYEENGRVCGVICGDDILRARYVVLAEGANSVPLNVTG